MEIGDWEVSPELNDIYQQARRFDLRRGGEPEEIVGAALYFATDASSVARDRSFRWAG